MTALPDLAIDGRGFGAAIDHRLKPHLVRSTSDRTRPTRRWCADPHFMMVIAAAAALPRFGLGTARSAGHGWFG
jgi:hypothetical protein